MLENPPHLECVKCQCQSGQRSKTRDHFLLIQNQNFPGPVTHPCIYGATYKALFLDTFLGRIWSLILYTIVATSEFFTNRCRPGMRQGTLATTQASLSIHKRNTLLNPPYFSHNKPLSWHSNLRSQILRRARRSRTPNVVRRDAGDHYLTNVEQYICVGPVL